MDYTVHGVAKSRTWLSDFHSLTHTYITSFLSTHIHQTMLERVLLGTSGNCWWCICLVCLLGIYGGLGLLATGYA